MGLLDNIKDKLFNRDSADTGFMTDDEKELREYEEYYTPQSGVADGTYAEFVVGDVFTISGKAADDSSYMNIWSYVRGGLEAGAGFVIASLMLTVAYRKLNSSKVPASFRGFPAMLIYLGIISMAVYSLK